MSVDCSSGITIGMGSQSSLAVVLESNVVVLNVGLRRAANEMQAASGSDVVRQGQC